MGFHDGGRKGKESKSTLPENQQQKHLKIGRAPKGNNRIPTIHFQVQTVSFREGRWWFWTSQLWTLLFSILTPGKMIQFDYHIFVSESKRPTSDSWQWCNIEFVKHHGISSLKKTPHACRKRRSWDWDWMIDIATPSNGTYGSSPKNSRPY